MMRISDRQTRGPSARLGESRPGIPAIALSEIAAGLARSNPAFDGMTAVALFEGMHSVVVHAVTTDLGRRAARIASRQHIRGCDAVYVALAQELGEPLITFDRQQSFRARDVITVLVPR